MLDAWRGACSEARARTGMEKRRVAQAGTWAPGHLPGQHVGHMTIDNPWTDPWIPWVRYHPAEGNGSFSTAPRTLKRYPELLSHGTTKSG